MWETVVVLFAVVIYAVSAQNQCDASESCIPFDNCEPAIAKQLTDTYSGKSDYEELLRSKFCGTESGVQMICCSNKVTDQDLFIHPNIGLFPTQMCGLVDKKKNYNQQETATGQFPWMAYLEYNDPTIKCTGTLITSRYILTPGSCLNGSGITPDSVVLGDYTIKNPVDSDRTQVIEVESFKVNRQFGTNGLNYDIGLIRLARHADMSKETIKPVCLPITNTLNEKTYDELKLLENERGADNIPGKILQKTVPIIPKDQCLEYYKDKQTQPGVPAFCAADSCQARIGNPVIKELYLSNAREKRFIQYGFMIRKLKDCKTESPVIYQSVVYHMYWILNNIKP